MDIYTIGHSNHTWELFSTLLNGVGIQLLVDVRSRPYSRWAVFANRKRLPGLLASENIDYVFMGDSLGGKPSEPAFYVTDGLPDYALIAKSESYRQGLKQLIELAKRSTTAIMCSEEDPSKCHRHLLIGPSLEEAGVGELHVRKDGAVLTSNALVPKGSPRDAVQGEFPMPVNEGAP
ncbi:MAG: DUF488 domain-containing protein [Chloroflexi bacterium]|nr:DUF488 domain-containing protein [Chloroflexota bacterium]